MTILQADGMTEVTLRGPGLQSIPQTAALRGPVSAASRRRQRRNLNTRRRPKNGSMARRRVPRANHKSLTSQMGKGQYLQREHSEDRVLQLDLLQVCIILHTKGDGGPQGHTGIPDPTLGLTVGPVVPDLEKGLGLTQGLEAGLDLESDLSLDPDLGPILSPDLDQGPGTDPDPDLCHHPEKGVFPDLQERKKQASQMSRSL